MSSDSFTQQPDNTAELHVIKKQTALNMQDWTMVFLQIYSVCSRMCVSLFTGYIFLSVVGPGGCTLQAFQQHGGHSRNHYLQFLGGLHGNYRSDTAKQNHAETAVGLF